MKAQELIEAKVNYEMEMLEMRIKLLEDEFASYKIGGRRKRPTWKVE